MYYRKIEFAEWIHLEDDGDQPWIKWVKCSKCGNTQEHGPYGEVKWCSGCGSWMIEGELPEGTIEMEVEHETDNRKE